VSELGLAILEHVTTGIRSGIRKFLVAILEHFTTGVRMGWINRIIGLTIELGSHTAKMEQMTKQLMERLMAGQGHMVVKMMADQNAKQEQIRK
jgi:hypothetical protein